jgi:hypothetical protein
MCGRRRGRSFEWAARVSEGVLVLGISSSACASRGDVVRERLGWQMVPVVLCRIGSGRGCGIGACAEAEKPVRAFFYGV